MLLKINGVEIAAYPAPGGFSVTVLDLDDADSTTRTVDGTLNRDRVAVKRQIELQFSPLPMEKMSALLKSMKNTFFDFYYPDPMEGAFVTKRVYVGNRVSPVAIEKNGVVWWESLQITLTEQ